MCVVCGYLYVLHVWTLRSAFVNVLVLLVICDVGNEVLNTRAHMYTVPVSEW